MTSLYCTPLNQNDQSWAKKFGNLTSGRSMKLSAVIPYKVGCMEPVWILNGCRKNVRMAMATAMATSSTSTFSRKPALGYGLSHLFAAFSRLVISSSNSLLLAPALIAFFSSNMASSIAVMACGARMSRWALTNLPTCLCIWPAWRTVRETNQRKFKKFARLSAWVGVIGAGVIGLIGSCFFALVCWFFMSYVFNTS